MPEARASGTFRGKKGTTKSVRRCLSGMKQSAKILVYGLTGLCSISAANAAVNEAESSSYQVIVQRNVFDLHGPPVTSPQAPTAPPAANIKLTGVATILGFRQALLMVQEPSVPGKPPAKEESYILNEGQREGPIHLLEVDEKAGTVKLENDGKLCQIALEVPKPAGLSPLAAPNQGLPPGPRTPPPLLPN